ncbi:unnamed protein product [Phytophthora lilii]|uniref:Unnamed protein product n=1 Tax=Phytophthora lilii TaxID=2077276 RepID=A0A9W6X445_9STRA|nr:unnamed protein product [Phytophthora lilii]
MEGGAAQLRAVPRDRSKIFKQSEVNAGSTTGSKDLGSGDEGTSSSSTSGGTASSAASSSSTSGGSSSSDTSASSSSRVDSSSAASSASESEDTSTSPPSPPSDPFQNASFSSSMSYAGSDAGSISSSASLASEPNAGSIGPSSSSSSTGTGTDTSSTPYGPAVLSSSDTCNHCAGALARCQGSADCMSSSRNTLVPFLADAELTAIENEEDPTRLEIDLGPVFQEFGEFAPNAFSSEESWHAFSNELYCLAQGECETGYDSAAANGQYVPSFLNMGAIPVVVHVTTYADTEWNVLMNGVIFSYVPDVAVSTSITDAVVAFQSWIVAQGTEQSLEIHAVSWDQSDTSNVATFDMKIFGSYDDSSGRYTLLPPTLIPKFTAVGGTIGGDSSGSPLAEASASLWALSLWSSGKTPQFDKLFDLLGYGIAGDTATAPAPSSTVASSSKMIGANDVCRKCASILSECQNDADCLSFSTNAVVPQLRDSTLTLHTEVYMDYGAATFSADIYPILFLTGPSAYNTQAAWDLVAAELYCLAFDACDMEYKDVYAGDTYYHPNMNLDVVRSSVSVKLRTYADTKWTVTINGNSFSYEPSTPSSGLITDAATELQNWVEALNYETSFPLEVQVAGQEVNTNSGTATLSIQFFGSFDDSFYQYMMVNPALIPRFQVAGGTTGTDALALAEANITLPSLVISTNTMKPQYSKLLDMLSYGIDGGGTTSATPEPTPTSASRSMGSSDPCRDCEAAIALCRYSADCSASSQNTLVPLLGSSVMAMSSRARDEYGSARVSLNMSSILYSLASMTTDAFRSRSAWDALASELACFSTSCDLEYDDVSSPFLGYHVTTSLGLTDVAVTLSVRTYTTTTWSMLLNGESLAYDQPSSTTIEDAAIAFRDWIETQLAQSPNDLVVTKEAPTIDSTSESATFTLSFHGATSSNANLLAPPWLIPQLAVTGGYTGEGTAFPIAGASTALWDVSIVSVGQLPQFGKLLDLLEFGLEPPS